jgi:hypothetical protein
VLAESEPEVCIEDDEGAGAGSLGGSTASRRSRMEFDEFLRTEA